MPWLTGDDIPLEMFCRVIRIPNDPAFIQALSGALLDLTYEYNWEQLGDVTPGAAADAFDAAYIEFSQSRCDVIPIGMIMFWLDVAVPDGWLVCDGGAWLKTEYPELYAHWGAKYGETTDYFTLPDMRYRSPYGAASDVQLDLKAGSETHTLETAEIPSHNHADAIRVGNGFPARGVVSSGSATLVNINATTANNGGGGAHNNLHPVYYGYWVVRAGKYIA